MWCRTILTAVAISYVICVLLLNGLQKEDLDANTLEKLRRHNVNIYDMNNEKLRQECLMNTYLDTDNSTQDYEATENNNETLGTPATNKSDDNKVFNVADYLKLQMRVPESYENRTISNNKVETKTENFLRQLQTLSETLNPNKDIDYLRNLENVTKIEEDNGIQIEYIQNQPTLQNMVNFWTKLTHNTKKIVTKVATTPASNVNEKKNVSTTNTLSSHNSGYVHSREIEYISRILAEYLASQTVPTTTERITTKEPYINSISRRIGELLDGTGPKDDFRRVNNFKRIVQSRKFNYDFTPKETKRQDKRVDDTKQQIESLNNDDLHKKLRKLDNDDVPDDSKSVPYTGPSRARPMKRIENMNNDVTSSNKKTAKDNNGPIRFLDDLFEGTANLMIKGTPLPSKTNANSPKLPNNGDERVYNSEVLKRYTSMKLNEKAANNSTNNNLNQDPKLSLNTVLFKVEPTEEKEWESPHKKLLLRSQIENNPTDKKEMNQEQNIDINKNNVNVESEIVKNTKAINDMINKQIKARPNLSNSSYFKQFTFNDGLQRHLINNSGLRINTDRDNTYQDTNKVMPIDIKTSKQNPNYDPDNIQFESLLPSIKSARQNNKNRMDNDRLQIIPSENYQPSESNKSEVIKIDEVDHDQLKIIPKDVKNPQQVQNYKPDSYNYGAMLPSIKIAKQNQNTTPKTIQLSIPTELNNSELMKNFGKYNDQFKVMQEEATKSERNKESKIKIAHDETKNPEQHLNISNPFSILPAVIKNTDRIQVSRNQLKISPANLSISEQNQKIVINNEQLQPVDIKDMKQFQNFVNVNGQAIPANIIKEIAEKVKQIVLRDMRHEATTNASTTSTSTTKMTVPINTTTDPPTEKPTTQHEKSKETPTTKHPENKVSPTTPHKEYKETNQVIQKLMEMFNEFKAIKESTKSTTVVTKLTTPHYNTNYRQKLPDRTFPPVLAGFNPYVINTPPVFKSTAVSPAELSPYGPSMVPAPISSGMNLPKEEVLQYVPQLNIHPRIDYHSAAITLQTNSDEIAPLAIQISKPVKLINQHIVVTTKSPFASLKEQQEYESKKRFDQKYWGLPQAKSQRDKIRLNSDIMKKIRYSDRHEYSYMDSFNKDIQKLKYNENYRGFGPVDNFGRQENVGPQGLGRFPGDYPPYRYPANSQKDGIGYRAGPYGYTERERFEPRYLSTKFHEKLERYESWPRNNWKGFRTVTTDCCEEMIAARHQMPLTKIKQRSRFDDTHFKNFLKSQQKVTDMLERILASNTKPNIEAQSVETP